MGRDRDFVNLHGGGPGNVMLILHQLGETGILENPGIMGTGCPAREDVDEVTTVVNNTYQQNGIETLVVDKFHRA